MHLPAPNRFRELARVATRVPVYRRLMSDSLTPVTAFHRLDRGGHACLFESVVGGEKVGRYSILATRPHQDVTAAGDRVTIRRLNAAGVVVHEESLVSPDPLEELRRRLGEPTRPML